eukprot:4390866-Pleurochrysis_carterae.AAC.1
MLLELAGRGEGVVERGRRDTRRLVAKARHDDRPARPQSTRGGGVEKNMTSAWMSSAGGGRSVCEGGCAPGAR